MDFGPLNDIAVDVFGEQVTWLDAFDRAAGGVFDSRYFEVEIEGGRAVSEFQTTLTVKADEVEPIAAGERLAVRDVLYKITDLRPDGQGMIVLVLERA